VTGAFVPDQETERELGRRDIALGPARSVVIRQRYAAPIDAVWQACTAPDRLNRWFIEPKGDLREGGTFSLYGNADGDILRCAAPHQLRLTWHYEGKADSEVELRLAEDGDLTVLELEHATTVDDALVELAIGWEMALDFLALYLRGDLPDTPIPETADFEPPPEMMRLAGERAETWGALVSSP
jgi:uncharacterized protein YndB with AHSA1/START domain